MHRIIVFFFIGSFLTACRKDILFTSSPDAKLLFSTDSVFFDTVFTSLGSTTARIKVFNTHKKAVRISEIRLYGSDSFYEININGQPAPYLENIELEGGDSLSVFVKVTIDPNSEKTPFLAADSIGFLTNGNRQFIQLRAYGQNVHLLKKPVISQNTTWDDSIPYLIYDTLNVEAGQTLTIKKGCRVYFQKKGAVQVKGTLKVEGTLDAPVTFAGVRQERIYRDEAGQWQGIHFTSSSRDNTIHYAVIKNAVTGLQIDSLPPNDAPKLLLTNSIVKNMQAAGIAAYHSDIAGFNNLIYNCGQYLVRATGGGKYNFKQNTFANYTFFFSRSFPSLSFNEDNNSLNLTLINNIIWGSLQQELEINRKENSTGSLELEYNLIKTNRGTFSESNILNIDPLFSSPIEGNYQLREGSPVAAKGMDLQQDKYFQPFLSLDLQGNKRIFPSSLGCYNFF